MANADIPAFSLYGEAPGAFSASLHIETIAARSAGLDWRIGAHRHRGLHQVLWVAQGPVTATLGAAREAGEGPLAVVIPPGVAHAFAFTPATLGCILTFDPRALLEGEGRAGPAFADLFAAARLVPLGPDPDAAARLTALLAELAAELASPDAAFSPAPLWLARAALWRLARLAGAAAAPTRATFLRFAALLEAHHAQNWPVTAYADALGLSVKRLNRLTRAETGLNAQACLHRRLIREACERLTHLDAPVSAIAFALGFEDPAYFTRFFKRMTGHSPSAWRAGRGAG
jgi:AraC family transcriptional activator of pobA